MRIEILNSKIDQNKQVQKYYKAPQLKKLGDLRSHTQGGRINQAVDHSGRANKNTVS